MNQFLPVTKADLAERGWEEFDFLVITGDAWWTTLPWLRPLFPGCWRPRATGWQSWPSRTGARLAPLQHWAARGWEGVLPSSGNIDSMVAHYTRLQSAAMTTPIPWTRRLACGPTGR